MTDETCVLAETYDVAMLDLDGVVYIGGAPVPGAAAGIAEAREAGLRLAFITNNASRTTDAVASHLARLDVPATGSDVVSSAQAAARVLLDRHGAGASIAVLGTDGLLTALTDAGLVPVGVDQDAVALVSGYGPHVLWKDVMLAATRVRDGLPWVASNTDATIPTPYGIAPGHGALVDLVRRFSGVEPVVAGKPARPLLDETIRRTAAEHPLMVGDRLDTDIAGAVSLGIDSLLVMTGVTHLSALVAATPEERPTYVAADLGGLTRPRPRLAPGEGGGSPSLVVGGWTAVVDEGTLAVSGDGCVDDWWHVVAAAAWGWRDSVGDVVDASRLRPPEQVASPA